MTAIVAAARIALPGQFQIQVENPAPGGGLSNALMFDIWNGPPVLTSVSPVSTLAGSPSFTITVDGSDFVTGSAILWDGNPLATTVVSSNRLSAEVSAASIAMAGSYQISVVSPAPGGGASTSTTFTVDPVIPHFAYAVEPSQGAVVRFSVDPTTGSITEVGSQVVGTPLEGPHHLLVTRSRGFLYTSSYGNGQIHGFSINPADGSLAPISAQSVNCGVGSEWMIEHLSGKYIYVSNDSTGDLCGYEVNSQTGELTPLVGSPYYAGTAPTQLAMEPQGRFLFVPDGASAVIYAFSVDAATGVLTHIVGSPFPASGGLEPWAMTVDPTGRFLFTSNWDSAALYEVDSQSGALTGVAGSPFSVGTYPLVPSFSTSGRFVYLPETNDNQDLNLYAYSFDCANGALSPVSGAPYALGSAMGTYALTVNNAETRAYLLDYLSGSLMTFDLDPITGALTFNGSTALRPDLYKLTLLEGPIPVP
jgi:6-phosphogluconolactonase (cycloisomerase 2 family)